MVIQKGREAQTISGGRRLGSPSRWVVALRPGELVEGGEEGCKDKVKRHQTVKYGGAIGVRSGGGGWGGSDI